MKLGLSTAAFFGRWETEDAAAYIASLPLDCAEVFLQTQSEFSEAFARLTRSRLGPVPCTSVHPLGTLFENALISRSARQRQDARSLLCRVLDAGHVLGAGMYVHHGRYSPQMVALPFDMERNAEMLAIIAEEAVPRGLAVAWENVCWCQLTTPQRVQAVRAMLPDVRFTLDIKQAMKAGCDPIEFVHVMGDRLINVHVCDWRCDGGLCLPGEGVFDFRALFPALREAGYDGPVIMEPYQALIRSDEALARSVDWLRGMLRQGKGPDQVGDLR